MHDRQDRRQATGAPSSNKKPSGASPDRDTVFSLLKDTVASASSVAGKRVAITHGSTPNVVVINSGMMMLTARPGKNCEIVISLLYAGDITTGASAAPLPDTKLTALLPSRYQIMELDEFNRFVAQNPQVIPDYTSSTANLLARQSLHAACLSLLTCEQKITTLLLELALNIGHETSDGISLVVPLSRTEISAYLALNVDTVSRTMTQIKSDGIITALSRRHIVINDAKKLMNSTPLADATVSLYNRSPLRNCFNGASTR